MWAISCRKKPASTASTAMGRFRTMSSTERPDRTNVNARMSTETAMSMCLSSSRLKKPGLFRTCGEP